MVPIIQLPSLICYISQCSHFTIYPKLDHNFTLTLIKISQIKPDFSYTDKDKVDEHYLCFNAAIST